MPTEYADTASARPADAPPAGVAGLCERPLFVLALFVLLSVAMTFPMILHFTTRLPAGAVDLWQNYWNFWWWKTALLDLHASPYHCPMIFHPAGADMAFHTHSSFNMLAALPVTLLSGPAAAYNFCVLTALSLSGFTMWILAREVTGDGRAGVLAGIIFTFFPNHMEQTLEHLNLFSTQFMPLCVLYLRRVFTSGGMRPAVGLGLSFALNALSSWHLGLITLLLLAPLSVTLAVRCKRRSGAVVLDLAVSVFVCSLIVLPLAWPLMRGLTSGENFFQKPQQDRGIDLAFLFIPVFHHPLWGSLTHAAWAGRAYEAAGFASFLGFIPCLLAGLGVRRKGRPALGWLLLFLAFLLLALGAHPWVMGTLAGGPPLPFAVFSRLPVLSLLRVANRFMIPLSLALAILAAIGWTSLRIRSDGRFILLAALILTEFLWLPYPMREAPDSPLLSDLAKFPAGAVLDIPFNENGLTIHNMRGQVVHGRPIAGGYLSTLPPAAHAAIYDDQALAPLAGMSPLADATPDVVALRRHGFRLAVLHKDRTDAYAADYRARADEGDLFDRKIMSRIGGFPDATFGRFRDALERDCGPPVLEDDRIAVFDLGADAAVRPAM